MSQTIHEALYFDTLLRALEALKRFLQRCKSGFDTHTRIYYTSRAIIGGATCRIPFTAAIASGFANNIKIMERTRFWITSFSSFC